MGGFRRFPILAGVVLAGVLAAAPAGSAANWPVNSSAVKMRMVQGRPVVEGVYVNGHGPYAFLLDTGTTANHLDAKLARKIGLNPEFRSHLIAAAGETDVPGAGGIEVRLGSVRAERQRFLFTGIEVIRQLTPGVEGVLGETFLSHFDFLLDLKGGRIEFGRREPASPEIRVPLRIAGARPLVSTSLGDLVLDSGTRWVTLFGVDSSGARAEMVTMLGSQWIGTVARKLLIQGRAFWSGQALAVPHSAEAEAQGLLPVSLFKTVYFCNSDGYVSLN
jgi:hypothetical protein